jgi:hypothetical protein
MPQSLLTGQLKEEPTDRVRCLYSSFVHDKMLEVKIKAGVVMKHLNMSQR